MTLAEFVRRFIKPPKGKKPRRVRLVLTLPDGRSYRVTRFGVFPADRHAVLTMP